MTSTNVPEVEQFGTGITTHSALTSPEAPGGAFDPHEHHGCKWDDTADEAPATKNADAAQAGAPGQWGAYNGATGTVEWGGALTLPPDLASIQGPTAAWPVGAYPDPAVAWATGESVTLADGSRCHWGGGAGTGNWVAGFAP